MVKKRFYTIAILYIVAVYLSLFIVWRDVAGLFLSIFMILLVPAIFGVIGALTVEKVKESVEDVTLLNCALIVKWALVPVYLVGAYIMAEYGASIMSPLGVTMIFITPIMAIVFGVIGWAYIVGGLPFSLGYIQKLKEQNRHMGTSYVALMIMQFIFITDIGSLTFLSIKNGNHRKKLVALIVLTIVAIIVMAIVFVVSTIKLYWPMFAGFFY